MFRIQFINSFSQKATASEQEGSGPHPEHRETVSFIQEQFLQRPALPTCTYITTVLVTPGEAPG